MNILSAATATAFIAGSALAADLPSRKGPPEPPPPLFSWTGAYVGLNASYLLKGNNSIDTATANFFDATVTGIGPASALGASGSAGGRLDGFVTGVQLGYNWQFADRFVAGFETDIQGGGVQGGGNFGTVTSVPPAGILDPRFAVTEVKVSRRLDYFGTVRGRFGFAVTPTLLAYATGGLAYGRVSTSGTIKQSLVPNLFTSTDGDADFAGTRVGWTVGGGLEWAFYPNLSAKLEYLYYDLGVAATNNDISLLTHSIPAVGPLGGALRVANASVTSTRFNGHVIRAGLNYHLDWGLPSSTDSFAAAEQPALGDWQFRFAPYAWAIGLNGNLTARGRSVDTNVSFYDVLTKSNHLLAWMSYLEARNGPFSFYGDIMWARLGFFGGGLRQTNPIGLSTLTIDANANIRSTLAIGEAWMGYELARWRQSAGGDSFTAIDAYGGLRYWYLSNTLQLSVTGAINLPLLGLDFGGGRALAKTGSTQWVDPILGLRLRHQIRPGDEFQLRGDIGGFGVGSKFSWQLFGGYSHDFKIWDWTITSVVGYRALSVDYSNGSGNAQKGIDAIIHGPVIATSFRF